MKKLLEEIIKSIVEKKQAVLIEEKEEQELTILTVVVDPTDMGKIIGRQGKVIKAIRALLKVLSLKKGKKIRIDLLEK